MLHLLILIHSGKNGKSLWKSCKYLGYSTSTSSMYPLLLSSSLLFIKSSAIVESFQIHKGY